MTSALEIETRSLWRCPTQAGSCVVRVDAVQAASAAMSSAAGSVPAEEYVVVVPAVRGSDPVRFQRGSRQIRVSGFVRRYKRVSPESALAMVAGTSPPAADRKRSEAKVSEAAGDVRQASMFEASPGPWVYDAVVFGSGVGGAASGLAAEGFTPVGFEGTPELAEAHRANGLPCLPSASGRPMAPVPEGARVRLVFCAIPTYDPGAAGDAPGDAEGGEGDERPRADPRVERAIEFAARHGASALIVEVSDGSRGSAGDAQAIAHAAQRSGFTTWVGRVDPAYLGLPRHRPTTFVVGLKIGRGERRSFLWPLPTHAPGGDPMRPFATIRSALNLEGEWADPDGGDGPAVVGVDAVAPPFGSYGPKWMIRPVKEAAESRRPTPGEVAALNGLPSGFCLCPEPAEAAKTAKGRAAQAKALAARRMRAAACSVPPTLARAIARAAMATLAAAEAASIPEGSAA